MLTMESTAQSRLKSLSLPDGTTIDHDGPVVIVGPNGAGKSRMGVSLARHKHSIRLAAVKILQSGKYNIEDDGQESNEDRMKIINQRMYDASSPASEFHQLMSVLYREHIKDIQEYGKRCAELSRRGERILPEPPQTKIQRIQDIWNRMFPNRRLLITEEMPSFQLISTESGENREMNLDLRSLSDGEKSCLYCVARIAESNPEIIIVDEPEVHLHPMLARYFWGSMESNFTSSRFVYITHDYAFALSRRNARYVVVRAPNCIRIMHHLKEVTREVGELVLGVSSLAVHAKRIVLCEGDESSYDYQFFSAWYKCSDTAVIASGSCSTVLKTAIALRRSGVIVNAEILSHVDNDFTVEGTGSDESVIFLPVHEIEGLFFMPKIAKSIKIYYESSSINVDVWYNEFLHKCETHARSNIDYVITQRVRRKLRTSMLHVANSISLRNQKITELSGASCDENSNDILFSIREFIESESSSVRDALSNMVICPIQFFRVFPNKQFISTFEECVGVKMTLISKEISRVLKMEASSLAREEKAARLAAMVVEELRTYFPCRILGGT